eukprot:gene11283-11433_t
MLNREGPLGAEEQRISTNLSQLTALALQDINTLADVDVAVPRHVVHGLESKVQEQLRKLRSVLLDLQYAAEEQETVHTEFQNARITYNRRKERAYQQQRQQRIASEQDALVGAQDVTASLRRTKQLMMQNIEQTHGNISVLAAGNRRLGQAGDELLGQKAVYKESHSLLGALKTQSLIDRWAGLVSQGSGC